MRGSALRFTVARNDHNEFGSLDPAISPMDGDSSRTCQKTLSGVTHHVDRRHLSLPIAVLKELR
jgi:hypothetical protein